MTDALEAATAGPPANEGGIRIFMIADVRGYTAFTQARGDEAGARLAARFAELAREHVNAAGGSVIELRGDEALAVFASPRNAIRAAVEIQNRFLDESTADPTTPLTVGIGLDAGEAVAVGDGFRGAPLNVAARLCSMAAPGEILASQEVVHLARRVEGTRFIDHGPTLLKGISRRVHVVKVVAEAANPYKGLRAFDEEDASDFHGREALVGTILERLREPGPRFLAVVGPSGSGKSSVVKAGVVPAVRDDALGARHLVAVMVPGKDPAAELAASIERATGTWPGGESLLEAVDQAVPDGSELLLVVDQFEELFTLVEDEGGRQAFIDEICRAALDPGSRVRIVVTLRADFYDRPLFYKEFGDIVGTRTQTVTALSAAELERAISAPAERVGVALESGLVAQIVADVSDQPGALPLLQYALTELFDHRRGTTMTLDAYREIGGVSGALVRRAEDLYKNLDRTAQDAARQQFLRLAASEEEIGVTRRRVSQAEIASLGDEAAMSQAIDAFGAARLLSFDRDPSSGNATIEVAHEALLVEWPRLRGWLEAASEALRAQRRLAIAAREWLDEGREPSFLLGGSRLVQFQAWRENSDVALTQTENEFLDASIAAHEEEVAREAARVERERELEHRSVRRLRALVAVMTVAALVAGAVTIFALNQRSRAEGEARIATARELAAAAIANLEVDPERSVLLAKEAIATTRTAEGRVLPEAEAALRRAVAASRIVSRVPGLGGSIDWSSDGVFVTEGPEDTGVVDIREAPSGEEVLSFPGHDIDVNTVAFAPDGSLLATSGDDGALKVWDPKTGDLVAEHVSKGEVWGPSFDAAGSRVSGGWLEEGTVRVLDVRRDEVVGSIDAGTEVFDTALSPDGRRIAVTSLGMQTVSVYDVRSGRREAELRGHVFQVNSVAWSPDGRWIATGSGDSSVRVWDARTGRTHSELLGHTADIVSVDWSSDSSKLTSSARDGTVKVWEVDELGGHELLSLPALEGSSGTVVAFSPDGERVISGEMDISAVRVWDVSVSGDAEWMNFPTNRLTPSDVIFLPDGDLVAPVARGAVAVWDVESGRRVRTIGADRASQAQVSVVRAPDDGSVLATLPLFADTANVWDTRSGDQVFRVDRGTEIWDIDWSRDGKHLATAAGRTTVIFDRNGDEVGSVKERAGMFPIAVAFHPDGDKLVTAAGDDRGDVALTLWQWSTGRRLIEFDNQTFIESIAFAPDGETFATAEQDGNLIVWDANSPDKVVTGVGHSGAILDLAYSRDGGRIATAGDDGTVRVFDATTGEQQVVLRGHEYLVMGVAFSPDGTKLASASPDGLVRVWALELDDLIAIAETKLTRGLTDAECRQYLHLDRCEG